MKRALGWTIVFVATGLLGFTALRTPLDRLDFGHAVAGNSTPVVVPWHATVPLP
jgi:hypothetical protein